MLNELDKKFEVRRRLLHPIAPNVNPNLISSIGFLTGPLAGFFLWNRLFLPAILMILANAFSDTLDGVIARKYKRASLKGSLVDDLADRVSDISISIGLGGSIGSPFLGALGALFLVLNSYLSLQGLALFGEKAKFGSFSRANRTLALLIIIALSFVFPFSPGEPALFLVILGGFATIIERALFLLTRKESEKK